MVAGDDERSEPNDSLLWDEVLGWLEQRVGKPVIVSLHTDEGDYRAFVFQASGRLAPFSGVTLDGDETRPRRGDVDGWYDIGEAADLDLTSVGILHADFGGFRSGLRLEISKGVWVEVNDAAQDDDFVADQIRKLVQLGDQGILTPEEFEAKKAEILAGL